MLVEWSAKHFNQATETPMARGRWENTLYILDPDNRLGSILRGDYEGPDMDVSECAGWLEGMQKKEGVKRKEFAVTYEGFEEFIKEAKESKSLSPSGRNYGHYKALREEEEL